MDENERDTHFQDFAKSLWQELNFVSQMKAVGDHLVRVPAERTVAEQIITEHDRKLVEYVLLSVECIDLERLTIQEHVAKIVEHFADYENNSWQSTKPS